MDSERSWCLRLAHHIFCHTCVGAHISRDQTTDLQGVVLANFIPRLKQVLISHVVKDKNSCRQRQKRGWIKQRQGVCDLGRYCGMKGDQLMSQTFLSADHHHLSSSEQWELDRHGPHTWTLRFGPLTPPGYSGDGQSWDALQRWKRARKWTHSSPSIMFFLIELKLWFHKKNIKKSQICPKKTKKKTTKNKSQWRKFKNKKRKEKAKTVVLYLFKPRCQCSC